MLIRQEQPGDIPAIRAVIEHAFGRSAEADLVADLRAQAQVILSLVAQCANQVVGHCLFSPVLLESAGHVCTVAGLGPVAVLPAWQRQRIGSRLIMLGLENCRNTGYDGVVVLGHPAYYPRFGFVPASHYSIRCEFAVPDDVFMAIELRQGALQRCPGIAKYQPAFNEV